MAITRRTRNAFVGLSRHKGSNPFISAQSPRKVCKIKVFAGFFVLKKSELFLESKKCGNVNVDEMRKSRIALVMIGNL